MWILYNNHCSLIDASSQYKLKPHSFVCPRSSSNNNMTNYCMINDFQLRIHHWMFRCDNVMAIEFCNPNTTRACLHIVLKQHTRNCSMYCTKDKESCWHLFWNMIPKNNRWVLWEHVEDFFLLQSTLSNDLNICLDWLYLFELFMYLYTKSFEMVTMDDWSIELAFYKLVS